MLRLRVALVAALLLLALPAGAQPVFHYSWGHASPQGNTVFGYAFSDAQNGWAVCGGGGVLATTDGGESWQLIATLPGEPHLYDVRLRGDGALLAVGEGAALYLSTDGGLTWSPVANSAPGALRDLTAVPGGGLSACGEQGALLLSSDGGFTWSDIGPGGVDALRYHAWTSAQDCFVVTDDGALRTPDAGATWITLVSNRPFGMNDVFFTDATHGYLVEDFTTFTSVDGGLSWTEHFNPTPPLYRYRHLALSPTHWLLAVAIEGGELWETTDAGVTWTQHVNRNVRGFPSLYQAPGGRVFFGSDAGDLYYTDDLGQTVVNAADNQTDDTPYADMNFFMRRPDGTLFAANQPTSASDPQGWLRSDDGGYHWAALVDPPNFRWASDGKFFDSDHGVVGSYQNIAWTDNGGDTWQETLLPGDNRVSRFALPAADRYFVSTWTAAGGGGIFRSDDGGQTWSPVTGGLPASFSAGGLAFADAQHGWVSFRQGSIGRMYRTVDGGDTWSPVAAAGLGDFVDDLYWVDNLVGLAAGRTLDCTGIFRTVDGGENWTQVNPNRANRLVFRDPMHGAGLFGYYEPLRFTDDGGQTWHAVQPPFDNGLPTLGDGYTHAAAPTAEGWVFGGGNNRIIVAVDETLTAVPPSAAGATPGPAARIDGSFPNPFNPSTLLRVRALRDGVARLAIHDATGRQLRVLLDARLEAGETRELRWDGRDAAGHALASGLYLARLESDGAVDGKKLLLLK